MSRGIALRGIRPEVAEIVRDETKFRTDAALTQFAQALTGLTCLEVRRLGADLMRLVDLRGGNFEETRHLRQTPLTLVVAALLEQMRVNRPGANLGRGHFPQTDPLSVPAFTSGGAWQNQSHHQLAGTTHSQTATTTFVGFVPGPWCSER